ncbi:restriction endonuclease subunit S [Enterococcus mundtii]|uniref:restriction endonuclease subunit S n=1 Tax=Enterococcus mundtii TaxID=53346 RepID=UPI000F7D03A9|nr:restriction endonuclease subunit S [Enterococcus mundtii]AZP93916.1 restriction endonuclease subunit S [Enterococcus mundtii]
MIYNPLISNNTPNSWQVKRLEEVSKFVSRGKQPKYVELSNIFTLNQKAIRWGSIQHENLRYHNPDFPVDEKYFIKKNDIVLNSTGVGTVGRVFHFSNHPKVRMFADSHVTIIRSEEEVLRSKFLYYQLSDVRFQSYILNTLLAGSTGQVELNKSKVMGMEILIPTIEEQDKIVDKLRYLDSKIELNNQIISNLEELASTLFKRWFVDFEFPDENGNPYKSSGGKMVDSELGGIPEGWHVNTISNLMENFDRKRVPLSKMQREKRNGVYPYYGAASLMDYVDDFLFEGTHLLLGEDGTVITKDGNPVLQYVWGKFWVNNHAHVLKGKGDVSTEWLYLWFKQTNVSGIVTGAVQPKISQSNLNRLKVVSPDKEQLIKFQKDIGIMFDKLIVLSNEIKTLTELRDSLLPKLLSGEIGLVEDGEVY